LSFVGWDLYDQLSTKFEVCAFTHCEDAKDKQSVEIGVVLGG